LLLLLMQPSQAGVCNQHMFANMARVQSCMAADLLA
jgi:hypothetical protein